MLLHSSLSPSLQCRLIGQSDLLSDSWCGQPPSTATPLTTSVAVVKCICDVYLVFEHKTPVRILAAAHHACAKTVLLVKEARVTPLCLAYLCCSSSNARTNKRGIWGKLKATATAPVGALVSTVHRTQSMEAYGSCVRP
mgnify:CR=1 FL=1